MSHVLSACLVIGRVRMRQKIIKIWLDTEFSGEERHVRRVGEIKEQEKYR